VNANAECVVAERRFDARPESPRTNAATVRQDPPADRSNDRRERGVGALLVTAHWRCGRSSRFRATQGAGCDVANVSAVVVNRSVWEEGASPTADADRFSTMPHW